MNAAEAQLADAKWELGQTTYYAPANGTVVALTLRPGAMAVPLPMSPAMTFVATVAAIRYAGATPVLVDADPLTWNIDPAGIALLPGTPLPTVGACTLVNSRPASASHCWRSARGRK
jgi:hypothetical protein